MSYSVLDLPETERPRERLARQGAETLSTIELLAIIFGSGTKEVPVLKLAQELMVRFGSLQNLSQATVEELCQIRGLGQAKAIQLKAVFCLGVRASKENIGSKYKIEHPQHAYHLIKDLVQWEKRELFLAILLDTKGFLITHEIVSIGTLSNTLVHPREVFYIAIRHKAASLIIAHNHPSGDPTPSTEDYELTKVLVEAGATIGIPIRDHLIVGQNGYVSLRQKGFSF
jgi:DNA repair protein RadC